MKVYRKVRNTLILIMPIVIVGLAAGFGSKMLGHLGNATLVLAGMQVPTEGLYVAFDELEGKSDEEIQKDIDALDIPDKGTYDDKNTVISSGKNSSKLKSYASAETPADIAKLIEKAKVEQADAEKDGDIREITYGKSNATDVYENIYVKNVNPNHGIDIKSCLEAKAKLSTDTKEPLVLIYHTHTTEAYETLDRGFYSDKFGTRSSDPATNMVRVGDALCERLSAAGYTVIHDREIHDTSYTGSYARSREAIENYKKQYPGLQVIIDVHRDGIKGSDGTKTKPVTTINGKKSAQIMIIAGCQDGPVTEFPGWQDNLNFAIQLQKHAEDLYPTLMRPIFFSPRKYNMDTSPCGVLLEFGSDANTLDEAVYAGALMGDALASLLNDYKASK